VAKEFSPNTTSDVAGGLWGPFLASPPDKVLKWLAITRDINEQFMKTQEFPVSMCLVQNVSQRELEEEDTYYKSLCTNFRFMSGEELGANKFGTQYYAQVTPPIKYMPLLMSKLRALGANFITENVTSIPELIKSFSDISLLVNCTGVGAAQLAQDPAVQPRRGVIVCIPPDPRFLGRAWAEDSPENLAYVIGREDAIVLGGTANITSKKVTNLEEIEQIIEKTIKLVPALEEVNPRQNISTVKIGLRPARSSGIRLELDYGYSVPVIHNYGHGGSGWSLFWGCAQDVLALTNQTLNKAKL
jgi:D-amino-acid oxidase